MIWRTGVLICCFTISITAGMDAFCDPVIVTINPGDPYDSITNLTQETKLYNHSTINSNIQTNGWNLDVYNYGTINGTIYTDGGFVRQHIGSDSVANKITVDNTGDLYVYIDGAQNINLTDIIALGDSAEFKITNSSILVADLVDWNTWAQTVKLEGNNRLIVSDVNSIQNNTVVNHGADGLTIEAPGLDPDLRVELSNNAGTWYVNIVNNSNYGINALNNANSTRAINRIKRLSYHFNPAVLMKPVKTINKFIMSDSAVYKNSLYGSLSGVYIAGDKTDAYGFGLGFKGKYNNVYLSADFNFHDFDYKDSYNDFNGLMYGLNVGAKTDFDKLWIDGNIGLSLIDFDANNISHNGKNKYNPMGIVGYGKLDAGYNYTVLPDLTMTPFVGASVATYKVYDIYDTDCDVRGGGKFEYSFVTDNIRYEYSGTASINLNGDLYGALKVGFMSEIDNAGISFGFDVLRTDEEIGYKMAVNGTIAF
jgi:hypothetical protein